MKEAFKMREIKTINVGPDVLYATALVCTNRSCNADMGGILTRDKSEYFP
jgi:hypothetical protein